MKNRSYRKFFVNKKKNKTVKKKNIFKAFLSVLTDRNTYTLFSINVYIFLAVITDRKANKQKKKNSQPGAG